MTFLDLLRADGLQLKRVSSTHGSEYAGPCFFCGGRDRFRHWPEQDRAWCRQCGWTGDAIQYVRDRRNMTFQEAKDYLGLDLPKRPLRAVAKPQPWAPKATTPTPSLWTGKAGALVGWAHAQLLGDAKSISYLRGRGLALESIKAFRLGLLPKNLYRKRSDWGLPALLHEDGPHKGKPKQLWIPAGILIPTQGPDGAVVGIKIRRWDGEPRYYRLPGSANRCLVAGSGPVVVVVESELDALLLAQVAGDLVTAVALGSAQNRPDIDTHDMLLAASLILLAHDFDEAGAKSAWGWWPDTYPQAVRWPVPEGKDPTEAHQAGVDLRLWVQAGIASANPKKVFLAPQPQGPTNDCPSGTVGEAGDYQEQPAAPESNTLAIEWGHHEKPKTDNLVLCRACKSFQRGSGDPFNAFGLCLMGGWDGHLGQWPGARHHCLNFKPVGDVDVSDEKQLAS